MDDLFKAIVVHKIVSEMEQPEMPKITEEQRKAGEKLFLQVVGGVFLFAFSCLVLLLALSPHP